MESLARDLEHLVGPEGVRAAQPLARYTALRVGGPADLLCAANSISGLCRIVAMAWERGVPCLVLGGGSNVLVSDSGVRGLVILNRARAVSFSPTGVKSASGMSFSTLARRSVARAMTGLEWAASIPGTVGGAVIGNAGAWGSNVASALVQATVLEPPGETVVWPVERLDYDYRTSALKSPAASELRQAVVLDAEFRLQPADRVELEKRVAQITAQRKASQPPGATCGSVFKNPSGDYAGRLIEAAGLKGSRQGGAEISLRHANFVVNRGHASAKDIKDLIDLARDTVRERHGVELELEIELMGDW